MQIGEQIKQLREKNKLSSSSLGKLVGLSQQQISAIENGASKITIENLEKICKVFGIKPSYFCDSETNPLCEPAIPEYLKTLLDFAKELTPDQLQKLTEFIKTLK